MNNIYVISDHHFSHVNFLNSKDENGNQIRKFPSIKEMDEFMIECHNSVIKDNDHVYFLGDVFFGKGYTNLFALKGKKRLILGNHDNPLDENLMKHFQKVMIWRIFKDFNCVLSHIPLREDDLRKVEYNVHGHIHEKNSPTPQHINVCVEKMNYTPIHIEELMKGKRK